MSNDPIDLASWPELDEVDVVFGAGHDEATE